MIGFQRITADAQVGRGPLRVFNIVLTDDGVGNADATFYEGANASGRRLFTLKVAQHHTRPLTFSKGLHLQDGLYVDVGTNVLEVFVLYESLEG